jgi:hypothetical protein
MRGLLVILALLCFLPAQGQTPARFGVVISCEGRSAGEVESELDEAVKLGVGSVRLLPDWTVLQSQKATLFDWSYTDAVLKAASERKLEVWLTLGNTPRWASRYPNSDTAVWNYNPPKSLDDWRRYVQALAARQTAIASWQVWERSAIHFFRGSDKDLTQLAKVSIQSVRKTSADALIFLPEPGAIDLGSINQLYSWGAERYANGLALYPAFARPEQMLRPLTVLQTDIVRKKGPLLRLWVAGFGWAVEPIPGPLLRPQASEQDQARYLVRLAVLALSHGVERVYWQTLRDRSSGEYQVQSRSGLVRLDGTRRPAFQAYQTLIAQLGSARFVGRASWGPHAYGMLFDGVLVAWTDGPAVRLSPPPAGLTVVGLDGSGSELVLSESPIYVRGDGLESWVKTAPLEPALSEPDYAKASEVAIGSGVSVLDGAIRRDDGWTTDLAHGLSAVKFAVDDSFAYFVDGRYGLEVEVVVKGNGDATRPMGFNLGYDSMKGYAFTRWQIVDPGTDWKTYVFRIPDADFSDLSSDFRVNAQGSKLDVVVHSVRVRKYVEKGPLKAYDGATR